MGEESGGGVRFMMSDRQHGSSVCFCHQCEERKLIDDLITNGIEEGMEVLY